MSAATVRSSRSGVGIHRPKVWLVTPELHKRGGTERAAAHQVESLAQLCDLTVFTMSVAPDVDVRNCDVVALPRWPGPHLLRFGWWIVANGLARRRHGRQHGSPDLVYSTGINALSVDAMSVYIVFSAQWTTERRSIFRDLVSARGLPRGIHRALFWKTVMVLERRLFARTPALWTMSRRDANELERVYGRPAGSVPTVPGGVDIAAFSPLRRRQFRETLTHEPGRRVALAIGNDVAVKGLDSAIRALQHIRQDVDLWIVTRSDHLQLRRLADQIGVGNRLRLWTSQPDVMFFYASADVLVAPSRHDAFGLPTLEALACGLPVVVSQACGVSELLQHEHEALLLADPEDFRELAGHVNRVIEEDGLAERITTRAVAVAQQWSWERHCQSTLSQLQRALVDRSAG